MKTTFTAVFEKILLFVSFVVVWQLAANNSNPMFIPQPLDVLKATVEMIRNGQLGLGLLYSFKRITLASLISFSIAIPFATLVNVSASAKNIIEPLVNLMRFLPITAFYPLLIMWFGIDEIMKIAFLFVATFVYAMPSVVIALDDVDKELIEAARAMGMSKLQSVRHIILPIALPSILQTFIMMYGIGWTYIAVCEQINAKYGLGFIIYTATARGHTDVAVSAIMMIVIFSVLFDYISKAVVRSVFKWKFSNKN